MCDEKADANETFSFNKEKIIDHLTKEIEVVTTNMITHRIRGAFVVWIGPFILLGSLIVATKGNFQLKTDDWDSMNIVIRVACGIYIVLGIIGGFIEWQVWSQCDKWRKSISKIAANKIKNECEMYEALTFKRLRLAVIPAYFFVFCLILASFWCIAYISAHVEATEQKAAQSIVMDNQTLQDKPEMGSGEGTDLQPGKR